MHALRTGLPLAAIMALAACKGAPGKASAGDAGVIRLKDEVAARAAAKQRAAMSCAEALPALPIESRDRGLPALLARCPVCDVSFEPLVALSRIDPDDGPGDDTPTAEQVLAVIDACGGLCSTRAREEIFDPLRQAHEGQAPSRPWRKLAEICPEAVGVDAHTLRFARGTWFALHQVVRALWSADLPTELAAARDAAVLEFPLPAYSAASTAIALPSLGGLMSWAPRIHVTIAAKEIRIGALAWVTVKDGALQLVDAPDQDYPGPAVALDQAAAAIATLRATLAAAPRPANAELAPVLIAPRALPARRIAEVVAAIGDGAFLAATTRMASGNAWPEPVGAAPIELVARAGAGVHTITLPATATARDLADALAAAHAQGHFRAHLVVK